MLWVQIMMPENNFSLLKCPLTIILLVNYFIKNVKHNNRLRKAEHCPGQRWFPMSFLFTFTFALLATVSYSTFQKMSLTFVKIRFIFEYEFNGMELINWSSKIFKYINLYFKSHIEIKKSTGINPKWNGFLDLILASKTVFCQ